MTTVDLEVAYALSDFVEAAKRHALGINLDDGRMQTKGCDGLRAAKNTIEKHTGSNDLLLPLLELESEGVRFNAAFTLIDDHCDPRNPRPACAGRHLTDEHGNVGRHGPADVRGVEQRQRSGIDEYRAGEAEAEIETSERRIVVYSPATIERIRQ